MKQSIPNLSARPRKEGDAVYIWQPGPSRRKAGWSAVALKMNDGTTNADERTAVSQARWLNAILHHWSRDEDEELRKLVSRWQQGAAGRDPSNRQLQPCPFVIPPYKGQALSMPAKPRHLTASDLWNRYSADEAFMAMAANSRDAYRLQFKAIIAWLGDGPVERVGAKAVKEYFKTIDDKPHLAALRLATARRVFGWSMTEELLSQNPFAAIELKEPPPRIRIWTKQEIDAALTIARAEGYDNVAFAIELGLATSQRPVDLCRMGVGHRIDGHGWRGWRIRQMKTGRLVEPVPDSSYVRADLIERLAAHHEANMQRFPDIEERLRKLRKKTPRLYATFDQVPYLIDKRGMPLHRAKLGLEWQKLRPIVAQSIPSIGGDEFNLEARLQDLRDTAITDMAIRGFSLLQICAQSGHEPQYVGQVLKHYVAMTGDLASSHVRQMANTQMENVSLFAPFKHYLSEGEQES